MDLRPTWLRMPTGCNFWSMTFLYRSATSALIALGFTLLQSCTVVGVDYRQPGVETPDAWATALTKDYRSSDSSLEQWWRGFKDPVLNELIDRSRASNRNLEIAEERIYEARAQRGIAASQLFPQANAGGNATRQRSSESLLIPAADNPSNFYSAGFDAGWEIDVFGGVRRSVEAADANIAAIEEAYRDTLVSLFAEVALNYIEYCTLTERIAVAVRNQEAQTESRKLANDRLENDLAPRIDLTQAETNLALTESLIPSLKAQQAFAKNRLATLTGGNSQSVARLLRKSGGIPTPRKGYSSGLPADLLRARPDVRQAERELAAQTAAIGIAEADLYPRFTLLGDFGLQSVSGSDFFDGASRAYSFGPSFNWQIFSAGRIRNSIKVEESRTRQALSAYENAVLEAVEEVETSMANVAYGWDREAILKRADDNAGETVDLILTNYTNGLVNFQNVLDAQRTLFTTQDDRAINRGQIARNYVTLYKALGGGTEMELAPPPKPTSPSPTSQP